MQRRCSSQHPLDGLTLETTTKWQHWGWEAWTGNKGKRLSQRCTPLLFELPRVRADTHRVGLRPLALQQVSRPHIIIRLSYPAVPLKARLADLRVLNLLQYQTSALRLCTIKHFPFCNILFRTEDRQTKSGCLHQLKLSAPRLISLHLLAIHQRWRHLNRHFYGAWLFSLIISAFCIKKSNT